MSEGQTKDFRGILQALQEKNQYRDLSWKGTFWDYLDLVKANPLVTRNSFQRMYDMVTSYGSTEYVDFKKKVIKHKFFQDPDGNGKDAVFGLDVQLMKLVNVLKAAAEGYGTEKRVILLHGPVGAAKSTICRLLKKGIELYSRKDAGALYTFCWIDNPEDPHGLLGDGVMELESPMHEEPLLLIPPDIRDTFVSELNRGLKGDFRIKLEGDICPTSRFIFKKLMEKYSGI